MEKGTMQKPGGEQTPAALPCELGLIAVATDHAIESELRLFLPPERAAIYVTRVALPDRYDLASLRATAAGLSAAAALLVPGSPLDVLAYGCTSATVAIGEAEVFGQLRRERAGLPCTTPITAAMAAFAHLGVARVALLTPYPQAVHEAIAAFLRERGIAVSDQTHLGIDSDAAISRVTTAQLRDAVRRLSLADADAIFLSCTSLRTAAMIDALEAETGRPVISSDQALAWHCLQLAGRSADLGFGGRLLRG
jgi:maleate isomerase